MTYIFKQCLTAVPNINSKRLVRDPPREDLFQSQVFLVR